MSLLQSMCVNVYLSICPARLAEFGLNNNNNNSNNNKNKNDSNNTKGYTTI